MKSPILYAFALASLSAPLFMGQAGLTEDGSHSAGGGGFGCSKAKESVAVTDTIETGTDAVTPPVETASDDLECPAPIDPINPKDDDVCDDRDGYASARGKDWSEEITSHIGRPVNETCAGECGGLAEHAPWNLSLRLVTSSIPEGKSYSFNFLKPEAASKVRYLEVKRDPNSAEGCPLDDQDPCWRTCSGECLPLDEVVKDEDTLAKEGKALLVSYVNDVCKVGLKVEDLEGDTWDDKVKTAFENATFKDVLLCAEGLLLTGTQVLSWVDTASSLGLIKDETGAPYTQTQIFGCVKKSILNDGSKVPPAPATPAP